MMLLSATLMAFAAGLIIVARATFRPRPSLDKLMADQTLGRARVTSIGVDASTLWGRAALWVMRRLLGPRSEALVSDLDVMEQDTTSHAVERMSVSLLAAISVALFGNAFGLVGSVVLFVFVVMVVFYGVYLYVGMELRSRADVKRRSIGLATNELVGLVTVAISGGSGLNSALRSAAWIADSPSYTRIRRALSQADVRGAPYSEALTELGEQLRVPELMKLGQTVEMSTATGARLTETLRSRLDAVNDQEFNAAIAAAEKASDQMASMMGVVVLALTVFMTYPLVVRLVSL
ncbi:MAG: hypothetical protein AAF467_17255 [Actinomycetota bacterium]